MPSNNSGGIASWKSGSGPKSMFRGPWAGCPEQLFVYVFTSFLTQMLVSQVKDQRLRSSID
jgi:hypothetical protein